MARDIACPTHEMVVRQDRPYGPEVDLWSLGVVLFGMAVGRMPFAVHRDKGVSAQERRKKLIAQVSRGATDHHVEQMAHFSPEFRDLVQVRTRTPRAKHYQRMKAAARRVKCWKIAWIPPPRETPTSREHWKSLEGEAIARLITRLHTKNSSEILIGEAPARGTFVGD